MATASIWQRPTRIEADIAIVGGGVIGTAAAWALRELSPPTRVVVLEAERLAHGASGRNAGFLLLGTHGDYASAVDAHGRETARRVWRFTEEAFRLAAEVGERHDVGFQASGSVIAAGSDAEAERLVRSQTLLAEDGVETEWMEAPEVRERLGIAEVAGALAVPEGRRPRPGPAGASPRRREPGAGRRRAGGATASSATATASASERALDRVTAGRVLLATNAWLPTLVPSLDGVVRPVRAQMLATVPRPLALAAPVYSHDGYYYVRQRADGRVLVGGARHLHRDAEVGLADATTPALQADLERYLARHLPMFAGVEVERRWSGPMGFGPDGLPRIGAVPGVPGAWWAGGFTGHGLGYALRFGVLAARRLLGLPDPAADLFSDLREPVPNAFSPPRLRTPSTRLPPGLRSHPSWTLC